MDDQYSNRFAIVGRVASAVTKRLALACLALIAGSGAAPADSLADCNQARNAELRLRACSDVIFKNAHYGAGGEGAGVPQPRRHPCRRRRRVPRRWPTSMKRSGFVPITWPDMRVGRERGLRCKILDGAIADYSEALRLDAGNRLVSCRQRTCAFR